MDERLLAELAQFAPEIDKIESDRLAEAAKKPVDEATAKPANEVSSKPVNNIVSPSISIPSPSSNHILNGLPTYYPNSNSYSIQTMPTSSAIASVPKYTAPTAISINSTPRYNAPAPLQINSGPKHTTPASLQALPTINIPQSSGSYFPRPPVQSVAPISVPKPSIPSQVSTLNKSNIINDENLSVNPVTGAPRSSDNRPPSKQEWKHDACGAILKSKAGLEVHVKTCKEVFGTILFYVTISKRTLVSVQITRRKTQICF